MEDARFEDAEDRPVRLIAEDVDDLQVISSLVQDAVFPSSEMSWRPAQRRFALLLNRFRWEDTSESARRRLYERVRSVLIVDDVTAVASQGVDRSDADVIFSILSIDWQAGVDGAGQVVITLAGDGALKLNAECLNLILRDVTQPYAAPSGKAPKHPD